jgi:hypothetical protein
MDTSDGVNMSDFACGAMLLITVIGYAVCIGCLSKTLWDIK